jgi:hypothetical protein
MHLTIHNDPLNNNNKHSHINIYIVKYANSDI